MSGWNWEPSVVIGCVALAVGYLAVMRRCASRRMLYFLTGVLLLLLDLVSPLDALGDEYLFSAHIVQHLLLALIVPPLLLLGIPRSLAKTVLASPLMAMIESGIVRPPVSWLLGVGTMIFWHVPAFFNAALASEPLHIVQHLSFLVTGVIFWWPVLGPPVLVPIAEVRAAPLTLISYLFSACLACSVLGAALTFAGPGLYPAYLNPRDSLGILSLIRNAWGLDPRTDQQLGGMLMWVPGCFVYLTGIVRILAQWYSAPQELA